MWLIVKLYQPESCETRFQPARARSRAQESVGLQIFPGRACRVDRTTSPFGPLIPTGQNSTHRADYGTHRVRSASWLYAFRVFSLHKLSTEAFKNCHKKKSATEMICIGLIGGMHMRLGSWSAPSGFYSRPAATARLDAGISGPSGLVPAWSTRQAPPSIIRPDLQIEFWARVWVRAGRNLVLHTTAICMTAVISISFSWCFDKLTKCEQFYFSKSNEQTVVVGYHFTNGIVNFSHHHVVLYKSCI